MISISCPFETRTTLENTCRYTQLDRTSSTISEFLRASNARLLFSPHASPSIEFNQIPLRLIFRLYQHSFCRTYNLCNTLHNRSSLNEVSEFLAQHGTLAFVSIAENKMHFSGIWKQQWLVDVFTVYSKSEVCIFSIKSSIHVSIRKKKNIWNLLSPRTACVRSSDSRGETSLMYRTVAKREAEKSGITTCIGNTRTDEFWTSLR